MTLLSQVQNGTQEDISCSVRSRILFVQKTFGFSSDYKLAAHLGISRSSLRGAIARDTISKRLAEIMANKLNLNPAWILYGTPPMRNVTIGPSPAGPEPSSPMPDSVSTGEHSVEPETGVAPTKLPNYAFIPKAVATLSAGGGSMVLDESLGDLHAFKLAWIKEVATSQKNLVLMDIQGDSMAPVLESGDTVLVDMGRTRIFSGNIYALRVDDSILIKKLDLLTTGRVRIISINPQYPPYEVDHNDVSVIGRVIWHAHTHV
jgi:phage repressor protein C with HTH and peptisase S24 domain